MLTVFGCYSLRRSCLLRLRIHDFMNFIPKTSSPMEPIGPISSRSTPATQLLDSLTTVQPLMWSLELERANHRFQSPSGIGVRSPYRTVWREMAERSRQRGTDALSKKDWPGAVFLPAWIVHNLMAKGTLLTPSSWKPLDSGGASKLISLLGGWQQDRGIYEFAVLPSKIIRQGEVNVALDIKTFAGMPSYAIYIDLESVRDPIGVDSPEMADDIPAGFLVGLNVYKDVPELVMASLKNNQVVVETLPLDGSSLDHHAARLHAKVGPGKGGRLSIMISALIMICLYRTKIEQVHDGASEYGVLKVWNRWRVGESFNETITQAYKTAKLRQPGVEPCIVAHWGPAANNGSGVTLRCSMGTSIDWKKFRNPKKTVTADQVVVAEPLVPIERVEPISTEVPVDKAKKQRQAAKKKVAPVVSPTKQPKMPTGKESALKGEPDLADARKPESPIGKKRAIKTKAPSGLNKPKGQGRVSESIPKKDANRLGEKLANTSPKSTVAPEEEKNLEKPKGPGRKK